MKISFLVITLDPRLVIADISDHGKCSQFRRVFNVGRLVSQVLQAFFAKRYVSSGFCN